MNKETQQTEKEQQVITKSELLNHWQGHRSLTRRVIEAFPEKELFNFSIGGMRTFSELAGEMLAMAAPGLQEIVTGVTGAMNEKIDHGSSKERMLELWDVATARIDEYWEQLTLERFHERIVAFGQYESSVIGTILYFVDNEIHHRGQGYVYLRALGITPPFFWERN